MPIPERALHLSAAEGANRSYCYTNFQPHFNPKYLLTNIILKSSQWHLKQFTHVDVLSSSKYGYQDSRPSYEGKGGGLEIHIRIDHVRSGEIRVCGYNNNESLSKTEMFLDPSYPFPKDTPTTGKYIYFFLGLLLTFFCSFCFAPFRCHVFSDREEISTNNCEACR